MAQPETRQKNSEKRGHYGYLVNAPISAKALRRAHQEKEFVIRLEVDEALPGGVANLWRAVRAIPAGPITYSKDQITNTESNLGEKR